MIGKGIGPRKWQFELEDLLHEGSHSEHDYIYIINQVFERVDGH